MTFRTYFGRIFAVLSFLLLGISLAFAQNAEVSGLVMDAQKAVIPHATVELTNVATQVKTAATTNQTGIYTVASLQPGVYRLSASASGFQTQVMENVVVSVAAKLSFEFILRPGNVSQTVTVDASADNINTIDASVSTVIDHQFVENIPLNGRSFQPLMTLSPGVSVVPSVEGRNGELTVNGQRTESNYFTVDGVSATTGANPTSPGFSAGYGGALPGETTLGTTQSLISIDALQEFRAITSTYSAEYGRSPGGQFTFTSRSGTNNWHGTAYDYLRNDAMDANNWFNNFYGLERQAEKQNDFGGTFGGPVVIPGIYDGQNRTFFFVSYEGLRLQQPLAAQTYGVPSDDLRANAPADLQPFLNAFPRQNHGDLGDGMGLFVQGVESPSSLDSTSVRIDHNFSDKFKIFGRYADSPSHTVSYNPSYTGSLSNPATVKGRVRSLTLGATNIFTSSFSNEFRFNFTQNNSSQSYVVNTFGGATPLAENATPGLTNTDWSLVGLAWDLFPYYGFFPQKTDQQQWNFVDTQTLVVRRHVLKWGIDYRRLATRGLLPSNYVIAEFFSADDVLAGTPGFLTVNHSAEPAMKPVYPNLSMFLQDEWKATRRLSLSLGLRWEWVPAPHDAGAFGPYTVTSTDLATTELAPRGTPLWKTGHRNFGPRIGFAYQLHDEPGYETVVRAGGGLFYDLGNAQASTGYWFGEGWTSTANFSSTYPLTAGQIQSVPAPSTTAPYNGGVIGFDPNLSLPRSWQWNFAVQQSLGSNQTLTTSYVGSAGRNLLVQKQYDPTVFGNPNFVPFGFGGGGLYLTTNGTSSDYNALQTQFQRRLSRGLQMLLSYTWAHSIDDASNNFQIFTDERASSDNDIRHNFQAAVTYNVPGNYSNRFASAALKNWAIDTRVAATSALPVDVYGFTYATNPMGATLNYHPDFVSGSQLYIHDPSLPGGRAINYNAFTIATDGSGNPIEGNFPRNGARGFGAVQTDLALQRIFLITDNVHLQFRAEAFNIFNHPIFGAINNTLDSGASLFGVATQTQNSSLGGLSSLYQVGGPRSLQVALKLQF